MGASLNVHSYVTQIIGSILIESEVNVLKTITDRNYSFATVGRKFDIGCVDFSLFFVLTASLRFKERKFVACFPQIDNF